MSHNLTLFILDLASAAQQQTLGAESQHHKGGDQTWRSTKCAQHAPPPILCLFPSPSGPTGIAAKSQKHSWGSQEAAPPSKGWSKAGEQSQHQHHAPEP